MGLAQKIQSCLDQQGAINCLREDYRFSGNPSTSIFWNDITFGKLVPFWSGASSGHGRDRDSLWTTIRLLLNRNVRNNQDYQHMLYYQCVVHRVLAESMRSLGAGSQCALLHQKIAAADRYH